MTTNRQTILNTLTNPIAYYTAFTQAVGDIRAGLLVSQLFYWHDKGADPDGWIYKTQKEIQAETGLTRSNQETARRRLIHLGILEEERRGLPARLYFKLNLDHLSTLLQENHPSPPPPSSPPSPSSQSSQPTPTQQVAPNPANQIVDTQPTRSQEPANHSIYTKTTTETTDRDYNNKSTPHVDNSPSSVEPQPSPEQPSSSSFDLISPETNSPEPTEPAVQEKAQTSNQEPQITLPTPEEQQTTNTILSLCEESDISFETLCATLDLYARAAGNWPDPSGIQAIILWLTIHGTDLVRESIRTLQSALLTRDVASPLRYLGGILKHKTEEAQAEVAEKAAAQAKAASYERGYPIPAELADIVIGMG